MEPRSEKILFWKDVIASPEIMEKYKTTIDKLREGDYRAADLDMKIKSHPRVYGIKINDKERLLFTTIKKGRHPYAYILEEMLDHKYETSKSMNGGVVGILKSNKTKKILADYFAREAEKDLIVETRKTGNDTHDKQGYTVDYLELDFVGNKWMELNEAQKKVLSHPFPYICNGTPGSGKTTLLILVLAKALADGHKNILVVTQSPFLKNDIAKQWMESPYAKDLPQDVNITIATYADILQKEYLDKELVDGDACLEWINEFISKKYNKNELPEFPRDFFNAKSIYGEFRIACGHGEAEYLKQGARQCLLGAYPQAKKWLWKTFQLYLRHLKNTNCIHAAFTSLPQDKKYSMIAIDEGQDFSLLQLSSLLNQAKNADVCIFHDSDQSLYDRISKEEYSKSCLRKMTFKQIETLELSYSYRGAAAIVRAANHILEMKLAVDQGRTNADQKLEIKSNPADTRMGSVEWPVYFNPEQNDRNERNAEIGRKLIEKMKERARSTQCAVITTTNLVEKAKKIFATEAVYTVEETKGLEYPEIIIYRLFDNPEDQTFLAEANKRLEKFLENEKLNTNGSREHDTKSNPFCNNLYTAIMRGIDHVYIIQEKKRSIEHIVKFLMREISEELSEKKPVEKTSEAEWIEHAMILDAKGKTVQARKIQDECVPKSVSSPGKKIVAEKKTKKKVQTVVRVPISVVSEIYPIEFDINEVEKEVQSMNYLLANFDPHNIKAFLSGEKAMQLLMGIPFRLDVSIEEFHAVAPNVNFDSDITKISIGREKTLLHHLFTYYGYASQFFSCLLNHLLNDKNHILLPKDMNKIMLVVNNKIANTTEIKNAFDLIHGPEGLVQAAVLADQYLLIKYFLANNYFDHTSRYTDGFNILQLAAYTGSLQIVKYLLTNNVVNIECNGSASAYATPLFVAADQGKIEVVNFLLSHGAKVNGKCIKYIRTPVMAALQNQHMEVVALLTMRGAIYPTIAGRIYSIGSLMERFPDPSEIIEILDKEYKDARQSHFVYPIRYNSKNPHVRVIKYLIGLLNDFSELNVKELLSSPGAIKFMAGIKFYPTLDNATIADALVKQLASSPYAHRTMASIKQENELVPLTKYVKENIRVEALTLLQHIKLNKDQAMRLLNVLCSENENGQTYMGSLLKPLIMKIILISNDEDFKLSTYDFIYGEDGLVQLAMKYDHHKFIEIFMNELEYMFIKFKLQNDGHPQIENTNSLVPTLFNRDVRPEQVENRENGKEGVNVGFVPV